MMRRRSILKGLFILLVSASLAASAAATSGPHQSAAPAGRFRLDVVAAADGKSASGLGPDDFDLREDGRKVPVLSAEFVRPDPEKRLTVILHDMNLWIKNVQRDKDEISDELAGLARSGISMMIVRLSAPGGLKVIQPFTRDENLVRRAVASTLEKTGMSESYEDLGGRTGEMVAGTADNLLLSFYFDKRRRFERAIGGLLSACTLFGPGSGRKSVLLVSGGIPDLSSSSRTDIDRAGTTTLEERRATMDAIHERARQTITQTRLFDPFGLLKDEPFEQGDQVLSRLIQSANAANVSFYGLDPGVFTKSVLTTSSEFARPESTESESIQSETRAKEIQSLRDVAERTGGRLFRGSNKFEEMRAALAADLEGYYALSFRQESRKPDGSYHRLEVRPTRKGIELLVRKGYREVPAEESSVLRIISAYYAPEAYRRIPFEAMFAPVLDSSGRWLSWIGLALPVKPLFAESAPPRIAADFALYVSLQNREGAGRAFTAKREIPVRLSESQRGSLAAMTSLWSYFKGPDLAPSGVGYEAVFVLHDPATGEIGGWSGSASAPDLGRDAKGSILAAVLGSIAANSKAGPGTLELEPKTGVLDFNDLRFYPRVTNLFSGGQDAWIFLQAHAPLRREKDAVAPQFIAFREGGPPRALPARIVSQSWDAKNKVWSGVCWMSLAGLEEGEHILEIAIPTWAEGDDLMHEIRLVRGGPPL
jgi:VWFA-related protein